ncbi:MAG: hypothetical protein NTU41_05435 [Chloroflexi bacterium]|nr:hypothetical protein [Chloroflexota bacterium]
MTESYAAQLWVNQKPIELNPFVEEFLARTLAGAVSSLKGVKDIRSIDLLLEKGKAKITVNGQDVPVTPFPNDIIRNTLTGLANSLKGVDRVETLKAEVRVS